MNNIISSSIQMTSLEIAQLVESQHGNVCISIERLAKKEVIQLPPMQKVENKQSSSPNNKTNVYVFSGQKGKRDSIIVVAQLSPEFTARLVDRWQALESGDAQPAWRSISQPTPLAALDIVSVAMRAAKAFGFRGNQAILSADRAVQTITGYSPIAMMGLASSLIADSPDLLLTPSDLAALLGGTSSRGVNRALTDLGFQQEVRDAKNRLSYELTETGNAWGTVLDTGKKHGTGTPVRQIKWKRKVLDVLRAARAPRLELVQ